VRCPEAAIDGKLEGVAAVSKGMACCWRQSGTGEEVDGRTERAMKKSRMDGWVFLLLSRRGRHGENSQECWISLWRWVGSLANPFENGVLYVSGH